MLVLALVARMAGGLRWPRPPSLGWLAVAFAITAAGSGLHVLAWRAYLAGLGCKPRLPSVARACLASDALALVTPSPAGTLARPALLGHAAPPAAGFGSTLVDRLGVLLVQGLLAVVAAAALWWHDAPALWTSAFLALGGIFGCGALLSLLWLRLRAGRPVERTWLGRVGLRMGGIVGGPARLVDSTVRSAGALLRQPGAMVRGLVLTGAAVGAADCLASWALARAVGFEAPLEIILLVPSAAQALAAAPLLPQGLGAVEGAGALALASVGAPGPEALAFVISRRLLLLLVAGSGGAVAIGLSGGAGGHSASLRPALHGTGPRRSR